MEKDEMDMIEEEKIEILKGELQFTNLEETDFDNSIKIRNITLYSPGWNKGTISNIVTFILMILGVILVTVAPKFILGQFILSFGLFGFSGGITNWLAVKMLFDRVLFLPGSGVIPAKFKEIRETVKTVMMATFFDEEYMKRYLNEKGEKLFTSLNISEKIEEFLKSDEVDGLLEKNLNKLSGSSQEGMALTMMLQMMGKTVTDLKPMIKPFVLNMGSDFGPLLEKNFSQIDKLFSVSTLRKEIDDLMKKKLLELTPEKVKNILESVIREHLGWLVLWGNVFGGLIGVISNLFYILF